jgi:hypothetical protein
MMIDWKKDLTKEDVLKTDGDITINFGKKLAFSSPDIAALLIIVRECQQQDRKITFILTNKQATALLKEFGFEKLGVAFK